jgi:hypothetical protein
MVEIDQVVIQDHSDVDPYFDGGKVAACENFSR